MPRFEPDPGTEEPESEQLEVIEVTEPEPESAGAESESEPAAEAAPEPASDMRLAKVNRSLGLLRAHVAKRLNEILGDDAPFYTQCELCTPFGVPGWRPPVALPPEIEGALYGLLGQSSPSELLADPHSIECDECSGWGVNAMPSRVPGQKSLPCVKCGSLGWLPSDDARRIRAGAAYNGPAPSEPPPTQLASALPEVSVEDSADVERLRSRGYAVIPPIVLQG